MGTWLPGTEASFLQMPMKYAMYEMERKASAARKICAAVTMNALESFRSESSGGYEGFNIVIVLSGGSFGNARSAAMSGP